MKLTNCLSIVLILAVTGFVQAPNTARNIDEKLKPATAAPACSLLGKPATNPKVAIEIFSEYFMLLLRMIFEFCPLRERIRLGNH